MEVVNITVPTLQRIALVLLVHLDDYEAKKLFEHMLALYRDELAPVLKKEYSDAS